MNRISEVEKILDELRNRQSFWKEILKVDNAYFVSSQMVNVIDTICGSILSGGKVLIFGNGGSATQASHFAGELVCRFKHSRSAIPAIALTSDVAIVTAQANDAGFETIFSRQIEAYGCRGDIAVGFTTSDASEEDNHSKNILIAFKRARERGLISIGFFSHRTHNLLNFVDHSIVAPSEDTALIQDAHVAFIHILCGLIEERIISQS